MNQEDALAAYVEKLNTHSWEQIAPHVATDAVFIFTEGTFIGHGVDGRWLIAHEHLGPAPRKS